MVGRCRIGRWACLAGSAEVSSPVTRRGERGGRCAGCAGVATGSILVYAYILIYYTKNRGFENQWFLKGGFGSQGFWGLMVRGLWFVVRLAADVAGGRNEETYSIMQEHRSGINKNSIPLESSG